MQDANRCGAAAAAGERCEVGEMDGAMTEELDAGPLSDDCGSPGAHHHGVVESAQQWDAELWWRIWTAYGYSLRRTYSAPRPCDQVELPVEDPSEGGPIA
jgi:hypothetical protein